MERVAIFIDGSNFYHGLKNDLLSTKIDFKKLGELLCGPGRKLIRIYYYNAPVNKDDDLKQYKDQQRFFHRLKLTPYLEVRLGRLEKRPGNPVPVEKGIDVQIAVDMLSMAYNDLYDTAILITGDGDFVSVVKAVKNHGKHVESAYFRKGHSDQLREACDLFIELNKQFLKPAFIV